MEGTTAAAPSATPGVGVTAVHGSVNDGGAGGASTAGGGGRSGRRGRRGGRGDAADGRPGVWP